MSVPTSGSIFVDHGCISVRVADLQFGLSALVACADDPVAVGQLRILLPDPSFIGALFAPDPSHPSVPAALEALGIGLELSLLVHRLLLPVLSAESLVTLPVKVADHKGVPVVPLGSRLVSYADVALLQQCWLLPPEPVMVTDLAREHMQKHHIYLIKKGMHYVSGKNNRYRSRYPEDLFPAGEKADDH